MAAIFKLALRLWEAIKSPGGIFGAILALWYPVSVAVSRAGDVDFLYSKWETISAYANSWVGLSVCVLIGLFFIARAVYQTSAPEVTKESQEHIATPVGEVPPPPLEDIYSRIYHNEVVKIDNKYFHDCQFYQVTFQWEGGSYVFTNAIVEGPTSFRTFNGIVGDTVLLLKFLRLLENDFAATLRHIPPDE